MSKDSKRKLPDPKIWKWCKHPECKKKAREKEIYITENEQQLMRKHPELCAVFYEDYCWKHLSDKRKTKYKDKIEIWIMQERSLENANLYGVELSEANLPHAQFQGAILIEARLQGATLVRARFQEAVLSWAQLQGAILIRAQFQGATLVRARFQDTVLRWAQLQGANFLEAELEGSHLREANFKNALNLHFNQIKKVGEENIKSWENAGKAYKGLKEYFSQEGLWKDSALAYYREKLMEFKHSWASGKILKGIWLLIFRGLAGFGEHPWKTAIGAIGTILFFSLVYWLGADFFLLNLPTWTPSGYAFLKYLYFSVVTFATLGFGDISPQSPQAAVLVIVEVLLGYFFLGLIVTLIARKVGR